MPTPVPGPFPPSKPYRGIHFVLSAGEAQALYGALEFALRPHATGVDRAELLRGLYDSTLQQIQSHLVADMEAAGISWQEVGT